MSKSICTFFLSIFVLLFSNFYSNSQERSVTYKGQQLKMTKSEGSLCIRYKDNTSPADMQKVFSKISGISSRKLEFTASSKTNSNYSVQVVTLKQNVTNNSELLRSTIELLRNNSTVDHVGSAYRYNDNILHFSLGEVIVKFRPNVSATEISNLNKLFKAVFIEKINTFDNTYLVRLDPTSSDDVFDLANKYSITSFVEFAHPNFLRTGMLLEVPRDSTKHSKHTVKNNSSNLNSGNSTDYMPNDTLVPRMWNLNNTGTNFPLPWITGTPGCDMRMFQAWETTGGNPNVLISITDTGIDTNHTDLRPNLCDRSLWYDAYDNDQKPYDEYYHGTGVSGIAIAVGNNTAGVAGIAYNCKVMPVRVFGPYPAAFTTDLILAKGLNWSWIHGASVINCSWGGGIPGSLISMAIENAVNYGRNNRGAVVVGGSGNTDTNIVLYPASMPEVIGAGGLSPCNERKSTESCDNVGDSLQNWGACYGDGMEVVAPCSFIGTTELGGGWCICGNGTSDSSPSRGTAAICPSCRKLPPVPGISPRGPIATASTAACRCSRSTRAPTTSRWRSRSYACSWGRPRSSRATRLTACSPRAIPASNGSKWASCAFRSTRTRTRWCPTGARAAASTTSRPPTSCATGWTSRIWKTGSCSWAPRRRVCRTCARHPWPRSTPGSRYTPT